MKQKILFPLLLVAGSLIFCLVMLEAALRLLGVPHQEAKVLCLDPVIGNVYCPGITAELDDQRGGRLPVRFNDEGMADRDYPRAKPSGTVRVALLGDSIAASLYLPPAEKFKALWEQMLTERLGRRVEILNFAIDGACTWDQLQLFHLRARHFQPDYVILTFFWGNDVWNNEVLLGKGRPNPLNDDYPTDSWSLKLKAGHRNFIRWLWNNTYAYQFLGTLRDKAETILWYRAAVNRAREEEQAVQAAKGLQTAEPVYDPAFAWNSSGWDLTRRLIVKLKQESRSTGARLIVFHVPMLDQLILPRPLPYLQFRAFLAENDIDNLDAFDALSPLTSEKKEALYIGDRVHFTRDGQRLLADSTLSRLTAILRSSKMGN